MEQAYTTCQKTALGRLYRSFMVDRCTRSRYADGSHGTGYQARVTTHCIFCGKATPTPKRSVGSVWGFVLWLIGWRRHTTTTRRQEGE